MKSIDLVDRRDLLISVLAEHTLNVEYFENWTVRANCKQLSTPWKLTSPYGLKIACWSQLGDARHLERFLLLRSLSIGEGVPLIFQLFLVVDNTASLLQILNIFPNLLLKILFLFGHQVAVLSSIILNWSSRLAMIFLLNLVELWRFDLIVVSIRNRVGVLKFVGVVEFVCFIAWPSIALGLIA